MKHMSEVGIRALKQNASAVVAAAAAGEEITITDRGRPVAQLVPLAPRRLDQLRAAGRLRPAKRPLADLLAGAPGDPAAGGEAGEPDEGVGPLSAALAESRDAERY